MSDPRHQASWADLDHAGFVARRAALLDQGWTGIDAGITDLYGVMARLDPVRFGPMAPSNHRQAPYRCHLAEAFLDYLHLAPADFKPHALISQGVRHSLSLVLQARPHSTWWLPGDVYPVYAQLAAQADVAPLAYAARTGLPWAALHATRGWTLLVCNPLKPWSTRLPAEDWEALVEVAKRQKGVVLVDAAYDLDQLQRFPSHVDNPVAFLGSLSKGWLLPYRGGLVLAGADLAAAWRPVFSAASKDEQRTREAFAAITAHVHRPSQVQMTVEASRARLLEALVQRQVPIDHAEGYWVSSPMTHEELLTRGVLSIPPSVFTSAWSGSVLSSLGCLSEDGASSCRPRHAQV
jgi:histidinol-phosphate/aromatic aminotransferase/cobyric acid decarboxylase-like protein